MSTRALCSIRENRDSEATKLFIHCDGYPDTVASRFREVMQTESRGCLATRLIRACENITIANSDDLNCDINYRYVVISEGPGATIDIWERGYSEPIYSDSLASFMAGGYRVLEDDNSSLPF